MAVFGNLGDSELVARMRRLAQIDKPTVDLTRVDAFHVVQELLTTLGSTGLRSLNVQVPHLRVDRLQTLRHLSIYVSTFSSFIHQDSRL